MTSLTGTAAVLVRSGKGILAADESVSTMNTRLAAAGVPGTAEHRRAYREMLVTTPHLAGAPGEKVTEGLDGLRERLAEYAGLGARFAKWRAVFPIDDGIPSWRGMRANAHALARYASLCHEAGLVPIVEPEALMDGGHYGRELRGARPIKSSAARA